MSLSSACFTTVALSGSLDGTCEVSASPLGELARGEHGGLEEALPSKLESSAKKVAKA